jgi:hypothetical protein
MPEAMLMPTLEESAEAEPQINERLIAQCRSLGVEME